MTLIYAGTQFPETIKASMAYAEGRRAEKARNFPVALADYETVLATYPDSPLAIAHLGLTYYRSGDVTDAIWVLGDLWGRNNPKEVAGQIDNVFREVKKRAGVK
jgi:tetratricopeptide (TPR) repeat protein